MLFLLNLYYIWLIVWFYIKIDSDDFIKKIIDLFVYDFNNNAIDDSLITHATAHRVHINFI